MGRPRIEELLTEGAVWEPGQGALLVLQSRCELLPESSEVHFAWSVHFRPFEIRDGLIVDTTLWIGCTGVTVTFTSASGCFECWTTGVRRDANHEIKRVVSSGIVFAPKVLHGDNETSLGEARHREGEESTSKFQDTAQPSLTAKRIADRYLEWRYSMHRGEKEVRDFLDETLVLETNWLGILPCKFQMHARPHDRVFFDHRRRALSSLASALLRLKLQLKGVGLPSIDDIQHELELAGD